MNGQQSRMFELFKNESNMLLVDGWTQPIKKKNCVKIGLISKFWGYLNKKKSFKPTTWAGFKPFKPPGHPFLGPSDRGSKRAQMPGPGKGRISSWWPSGLRPPERKITAVKKRKLLKFIYIYIYCTYKNYEWEWIFWRMIHVLFHPKMKSI